MMEQLYEARRRSNRRSRCSSLSQRLRLLVGCCFFLVVFWFGDNNVNKRQRRIDPLRTILVSALENGVGLVPPMGWISWQRFGCETDCDEFPDTCISSNLYLQQAKEIVRGGYRDAGYVYVNIDDCWSLLERDNVTGEIVEDPIRFPNGGLQALGQQLHDMGLKFGLYTDIGKTTCAGYPGLNEGQYYDIDANKFANVYKIDSLKVDGCNANEDLFNVTFPEFGAALNRTGRPILYNCKWSLSLNPETSQQLVPKDDDDDPTIARGTSDSIFAVAKYCNIWREYYDITNNWDSIRNIINYWTEHRTIYEAATGIGHYLDPDMLVIGNNGLSITLQQIQFVMWSIFAAPLHISADLRTIRRESQELLLNRDIIAVNQDPLGKQGYCVHGCPTNSTKGFSHLRIYVREVSPSPSTGWCLVTSSDKKQQYSKTWVIAFMNIENAFGLVPIQLDVRRHLPMIPTTNFTVVRDLLHQKMLNDTYDQYLTVKVDENSIQFYRIVFDCCCCCSKASFQSIA